MQQGITRLSYSLVSEYGDCGEKVRLKRVEKAVSTPTFALAGGSAVHEASANRDLLELGVPVEGPTEFEDAFAEEILELVADTGIPMEEWRVTGKPSKAFPNKEDYYWWMANGPIFVENWHRFLRNSPFHIAILPNDEYAVEFSLDAELGGAPFKGYVDRVLEDPQGNLYIVDLKSGVRTPKPNQLRDYRIVMRRIFGDEFLPSRGFYFMNRTGMMSDIHNLAAMDDGAAEHEYAQAWTGIQNGVFVPNTTSGWCSSCDVAKYCYANNGELSADYAPYRRLS